jgi:hypothetical protein
MTKLLDQENPERGAMNLGLSVAIFATILASELNFDPVLALQCLLFANIGFQASTYLVKGFSR